MLPSDLSADEFYEALTMRNRGLIAPATQRRLREARLVIAGCGSTGGAAVMPLARTGAVDFLLADPDTFELSNLNRQNATIDDIGENKARVAARHIRSVNPHASVEVLTDGVPTANADALLRPKDIVIDAIDVTTADGIAAKKALHDAAALVRVPVVTAYDIAGCQFIEIFDYRAGGEPLGGAVADKTDPQDVLAALIPASVLPEEILPIIVEGADALENGFPQLAMTASLFGALVVPIVLKLVDELPLRQRIRVDLGGHTTPQPARVVRRLRTFGKLPLAWAAARKRGHR